MSIITISRGTMSGGILLAEAVGRRLDATVSCREDLIRANPLLAEMESELGGEILSRPPYMYDTLQPLRDAYLALFRAELTDLAARGPVIYHGNGGQLLLRGLPGLLRVRVAAPLGMRLDMVSSRLGFTRIQAGKYIHEKDEGRTRWTRFLYEVESLRDELYHDLILNLETLDVEDAAAIVAGLAELAPFTWDDADRRRIRDLALAARTTAALQVHPNTRMIEADVVAEEGRVTIAVDAEELGPMKREIEETARAVEGVVEVRFDEGGRER